MVDNTTYSLFIERYMKKLPLEFKWQKTPVQIYPLEFLSQYLELPTPLIRADYNFLILLNSGKYNQQIGIEDYYIKAPSVLFVPEGEAFSIKSIQNDLSGYFILLENKSISPEVSKIELAELSTIENLIILDSESIIWLTNLCKLLFNEVSLNNPNRNIGTGLVQALLHKIKDISGNKRIFTRQNNIAIRFKQLVNENYINQKTVKFYARELCVSDNYLNRCAKSQFNKNSKQIIQETAILQSQILMFNTTKDISEICFQVGYDDPSYFSRLFKKTTGQTPTEFKNRITHNLS